MIGLTLKYLGQRQRLLLALALCNDPQLILLDEPTTGLDPQARRHLWQVIQNVKKSGKSIILTTHYMDEAAKLCDSIKIMDHGKILASGSPDELLRNYAKQAIIELPSKSINGHNLDSLTLAQDSSGGSDIIEIATDNLDQTLKVLVDKNLDLSQLMIRKMTLEDIFVHIIGKELRA